MADITLFELHLDDASFSNTSPFFGGEGDETEDEGGLGSDDSGGAAGKLSLLLALAGIVALAWLVSRSEVAEDIEIDEEIELTS